MLGSKPGKSDMDLTKFDEVYLDIVLCETSGFGESLDSVFLRCELGTSECQSQSRGRLVIVDIGLFSV